MGKNKTIPSGERTIILRVLHFFEEEKKKGSPLLPLKKALSRTSTATGVSLSTITRIKREELKILQEISPTNAESSSLSDQTTSSSVVPKSRPEVILPTPGKKRRPAHNKMIIDDVTISAIKGIVENFYKEKNELPTLNKILAVAKADLNFPGQKETLRKILNQRCGYTFTKCAKRNDLLKGRTEVGFWRIRKSKVKKPDGADKKLNKFKKEQQAVNKTNNVQNNTDAISNELNKVDNGKNESNVIKNEQSEISSVRTEFSQIICEQIDNNKIEDDQSVLRTTLQYIDVGINEF